MFLHEISLQSFIKTTLEQDTDNLLVLGLRLELLCVKRLQLIQLPPACCEVNMFQRYNLGLLDNLPSNPATSEDGNGDVSGEEG